MTHVQLEIFRVHNMNHNTFISIVGAFGVQPANGKGIAHFQLGIIGHALSDQHRDSDFIIIGQHLRRHVDNILYWIYPLHDHRHDAPIGID